MPRDIVITMKAYQFDELSEHAKEVSRQWYREYDVYDFDAKEFREETLEDYAENVLGVKADTIEWQFDANPEYVTFWGDIDLDVLKKTPDGVNPLEADRVKLVEYLSLFNNLDLTVRVKVAKDGWHYCVQDDPEVEVEGVKDSDDLEVLARELLGLHFGEAGQATDPMIRAAFGMPWEELGILCDYLEDKDESVEFVVKMRDLLSHIDIEDKIEEFRNLIIDYVKEAAWKTEKAGRDELDYRNSDEVVDDNIRANEYEFDEDGNRFVGGKRR